MSKLVIISHTQHQVDPLLGPVGWGPTVNEINFVSKYWDELTHVACLEDASPAGSSLPYTSNNITFTPIPMFGGISAAAKLRIIWKLPKILRTIHKSLNNAAAVQLRLPMGIGLPLILYFWLLRKRRFKLWVKFATNWGQRSSSPSVRLQRYLLEKNILKCPVTINGQWPNQPIHCKSFENPCLTNAQFKHGENVLKDKYNQPPFTLIFVGRIEAEKGIDLVIDSISKWPKELIQHIHFVGDGPLTCPLRKALEEAQIQATIHGYKSQEEIFRLYQQSHFVILPSKSEGFPKVIAEALNFGCIPIVSQVGSISHYIKESETGVLMANLSPVDLKEAVTRALTMSLKQRQQIMQNGRFIAQKFTFESYVYALETTILRISL